MKIVSKAELMQMPKGTPFARWIEGQWPDSFEIFVGTFSETDFMFRSVGEPQYHDTAELFAHIAEMEEAGASYPVDLTIGREGLYDPDDRYVVWEPDDVRRIINLLQGGDDERDAP